MTIAALVFAHLGHWYVGGPAYLGPPVLFILWAKLGGRRRKRKEGGRRRPDR